ncbi:MAG: ABC transporter ATP-binding protein [Sarcina sp.]
MIKIFKYLKPYIVLIIGILMLLIVQASSDLALPDYTANIVNIGIQQGGIDSSIPRVIRESEMEKVKLFLSDEDKKMLDTYYTKLNAEILNESDFNKKLEQYKILEKETLYELNSDDESTIQKLESIMPRAMMSIKGVETAYNNGQIPNIPQGKDIWSIMNKLPIEQLNEFKKTIDQEINKVDNETLKQASISIIKEENENIGIDVEKVQTNYILNSGIKMLMVALVGMIAAIAVGFLGSKVASGMGRNLRKDIFKKIMTFSNTEFDKFSTASLITRSTNDIQQVQTFTVIMLKMMIYAPILAIGGIIKVIKTDISMGWIICVGILAIFVLVAVLFKYAVPKSKIIQKLIDKLNLISRESLTGMLVIRAFGTQKIEEQRFDNTNKELTKTNIFLNRIMSMMMPTMMLVMNIMTILIVWVGAHNIDNGTMQVGSMMAFIQYAMQIMMAFLMLSMLTIFLPRAAVSAGRIVEVLNANTSINDGKNEYNPRLEMDGEVEFKNVSFKYPNAEEDVISNISFKSKVGQTTAFIGSTGSGKSTIVNLIPRFFDVTKGEILVGGANIKEIKLHDLREKIGYIPQKGFLFSGTIKSNINYGKKQSSVEETKEAARIAQALDFIEKKEEGFDFEISQEGSNVSGGQKQRLSIARALVKKSKIFIFDDSFSALDLKTDSNLRKELKEHVTYANILIVAQRISTIINADQIIVLDEGKIVGKGTHKELMNDCEVYRQIALSQLSQEEVEING